jgi:hypothetical protein
MFWPGSKAESRPAAAELCGIDPLILPPLAMLDNGQAFAEDNGIGYGIKKQRG